jgi:ornithine--oxo-acid transaminase
VAELARRYDSIDRIAGKGLMRCIYFRPSSHARLRAEQLLLEGLDSTAFAAAVHLDLYRHRVLVQVPGPGINAIKLLPPACATEDDVASFLAALDDVLGRYHRSEGPAQGLARAAMKEVVARVPSVARRVMDRLVLSSSEGLVGPGDASSRRIGDDEP